MIVTLAALSDRPPGLWGWAFRPRNFMKNRCRKWGMLQLANRPEGRGFSTLSPHPTLRSLR